MSLSEIGNLGLPFWQHPNAMITLLFLGVTIYVHRCYLQSLIFLVFIPFVLYQVMLVCELHASLFFFFCIVELYRLNVSCSWNSNAKSVHSGLMAWWYLFAFSSCDWSCILVDFWFFRVEQLEVIFSSIVEQKYRQS